MCCLFGLLDIGHSLSSSEKNHILSILGTICEARGVDATGYSYVSNRNLIIKKKAIPAHEMAFKIPGDAYAIMGHTRMATQGSAARQKNNHPFSGKLPKNRFSLAHNGVLSNDKELRRSEQLPKTDVETDSYVAVQLIEKQRTLDFHSLKAIAEMVKGSFVFTLLDMKNNLFIIKGNNPLCLYFYPKENIYIYASTKAILDAALDILDYLERDHEEIRIADGEILKIDAAGKITRDHFKPPATAYSYGDFYDYYEDFWANWEPVEEEPGSYRKYLMDYAVMIGIPKQELDHLHRMGLSDFEMEECVYDKRYRKFCLLDTGYYEKMEETIYDDCVEALPRVQA